ncbi:MAG TPA: imidazolonepropionase [Longimicrobiaceae bacterium]|nr:imidazolonepropionase [Longimicrobiaceae bacterium]
MPDSTSASTLLFTNAAQVAACTGPTSSADGQDPAAVREGAAVAVQDGRIAAVGAEGELLARWPGAQRVDCAGGVLTPGLVDSHTHAVFGRWRADEYVLRCTGVPYMEIARRGGGINASVRDLRERSEDELVRMALPRLREMLVNGTTTAEVKSGYGLSTADELKTLRAIRRLGEMQPIELVPTFLGAHEFPPEYRDRRDAYVDLLVEESIPAVAEAGLARFCDVFMEPGVFDRAQTGRILRAGLDHGLRPKLHADELEGSGGAELAAELGAASADHLGDVSGAGIRALAASGVVATLLPATLFFLGRPKFAPARALLEAGATVALATDFNPGSSPTPSLPFVMTAACSRMGMSPAEALRAATAGGAAALEVADGRGTLAPGAPADLALWRAGSVAEIPYRLAAPVCAGVWKRGHRVV